MADDIQSLAETYGPLLAQLNEAVARNDEPAFRAAVDAMQEQREGDVTRALRTLTGSLLDAMLTFRKEFRISALAEREVPDARARLNHVMKLTDEAAHKTMDLIEQCGPLADRANKTATMLLERGVDVPAGFRSFLQQTADDCSKVRANLNEVIIAQTYQDLTGQIIRGVVTLVGEVEHVLAELMRMTGATNATSGNAERTEAPVGHGFGPAVPGVSTGVVQGQEDIDALMAGLGI
ncbi:MAG: hypothetical protein RLZZ200_2044 [Pseudomonadota bacterium]|jgi:chemotaxis protein CheZ